MNLFKYQLIQIKNIWNNFILRIKIEILILAIIFGTFFTTKFIPFLNQILRDPQTSEAGLIFFISHVFIFLISLTTPYIGKNLISKQRNHLFYKTLPLTKDQNFIILWSLYMKYQILYFIVLIPLSLAVIYAFFWIYVLYLLVLSLISQIFFILLFYVFKQNFLRYFFIDLLLFLCAVMLYYRTDLYYLFDVIILLSTVMLYLKWRKDIWLHWNEYESQILLRNIYSDFYKINYFNFPRIFSAKMFIVFFKDLINLIRNKRYLLLKIWTVSFFSIFLIIVHSADVENRTNLLLLGTVVIIWLHYSSQFNEKYIKAEPVLWIKTLPLKYHHFWMAKFSVEIIFVLIILLILSLFIYLEQISLNILLIPALFSIAILTVMTFFRILFYDKIRFAGYAYHFFVIFAVVMSINYYLVGPVMTLLLILFFSRLSYKEFNK